MKKILLSLALVLTLAPAAGACSVKAGYVAKGVVAVPAGLSPECGVIYNVFSKNALSNGVAKWTELYSVANSRASSIGEVMESALKRKGFVQIKQTKIDNGYQLGYVNPSTKKLILVQLMVIEDNIFMGILGN